MLTKIILLWNKIKYYITMNIKRLFEKTNTGFKEFIAKIDFANVIGLSEELTKYIKKDSNDYVATINADMNVEDETPKITYIDGAGGINDIYLDLASEDGPGLMTRDDKIKLNNLPNLSNPNILTDIGNYERSASFINLVYKSTSTQTPYPKIRIEAATTTYAGVMTASDKTKLDDIPNTYLPLSGGTLTGTLNIDFTEGIQIIEYDLNPRNTYIGNGSIIIESLDSDTDRVTSKTEINSNSITTTNATIADKVKANGFLANNNGNGNTAWTTNGGSINLINLLSNAAIYVAGRFELIESNVNNTTVIDNPDSIIFSRTGRFLAKKDSVYYTHWNADISKNIAPPSRYGIETDNGVFPFNNQMYKFSQYDDIFIATCSNGTCSMEKLTLE